MIFSISFLNVNLRFFTFCCCVMTPVPPFCYILLFTAHFGLLLTDHSFYSLFIFQYDSNILAPTVAPQEKKIVLLAHHFIHNAH